MVKCSPTAKSQRSCNRPRQRCAARSSGQRAPRFLRARALVGSGRVGRSGVTSSAAKSGVIPALSRNGDVPSGDEPGRLPRRRESSPSDEGRFVRHRRRSSFVLLIEWRMSMARRESRVGSAWRSLDAPGAHACGRHARGDRHASTRSAGASSRWRSCRTTSATTAWASASASRSPRGRSGCATRSTPITSPRSTTRRASCWPTAAAPLGSGFFFALGHSSVVMVVGVGITVRRKGRVQGRGDTAARRSSPPVASPGRRCRRRSCG